MATVKLKRVSATYEVRAEDGYTYRFIVNEEYTLARRVESPSWGRAALWNHGVLCQQQEMHSGEWKPSCAVKSPKLFKSLDEALEVLGSDVTILEV